MRTLPFLLVFLLIITSCDKEEMAISTELSGYWKWKSTCGGFVGCVYPSDAENKFMLITDTNIDMYQADDVISSSTYMIQNTTDTDSSKVYELALEDGSEWTATIENNNLTVHHIVFTSVYERVKKD